MFSRVYVILAKGRGGYAWSQVRSVGGMPGTSSLLGGVYLEGTQPTLGDTPPPTGKVHPLEDISQPELHPWKVILPRSTVLWWHLLMATEAGDTHPTGMLSCLCLLLDSWIAQWFHPRHNNLVMIELFRGYGLLSCTFSGYDFHYSRRKSNNDWYFGSHWALNGRLKRGIYTLQKNYCTIVRGIEV